MKFLKMAGSKTFNKSWTKSSMPHRAYRIRRQSLDTKDNVVIHVSK